MAVERRQHKAQSRQSPPRRDPYGGFGDERDVRPRSRSPVRGREPRDAGREPRAGHPREGDPRDPHYNRYRGDSRDKEHRGDARDPAYRDPYAGYGDERDVRPRSRSPVRGREPRDVREPRDGGREPRGGHPRESDPRDAHYDRFRGDSRDKEHRGEARDSTFRDEGYDRYYRVDDYYRRKDEPFFDRYRDPWNGRREPEDDRVRPEERRRDMLYRQYYEELQRRYDSERPVDCSVIVVNKQQKDYAETVGRKVRDLGMVVDLIFLNTEVSLTQALEDVGRARTPFAIIITQQHQVHRSCTVNILFGTPQEHRNMPMQDAMMLVAHNYEIFKAENRDKERDEIARKAAKMADDVLMREHERESHPISVQPIINLLSEGRFLNLEELDRLIDYLRDKRERLMRTSGEPHQVSRPPPSSTSMGVLEPPPPSQNMTNTSHLPSTQNTNPPNPANHQHQQELQAKILSLFNSGSGTSAGVAVVPPTQTQGYGSTLTNPNPVPTQGVPPPTITKMPTAAPQVPTMMGQTMNPRATLRPPAITPGVPPLYNQPAGRMAGPAVGAGGQRPAAIGSGINFDNPSVQKALDTLIQSGPALNHIVNPGNTAGPRPGQNMGQPTGMGHYPRHY
ncbi:NCOA5 protein, partial [Polypterus senegalus]|nr:nuclear receptor coactivator 5 isoform X2 [Polypterus senegalus]MBN3294576.1 NCOA5 protein [Polypterus senegalus]